MSALPIVLQLGRIEGLLTAAGALPSRRAPRPKPPEPPNGLKPSSSSADDLVEERGPRAAGGVRWDRLAAAQA